jgi:hypothetical protein
MINKRQIETEWDGERREAVESAAAERPREDHPDPPRDPRRVDGELLDL